MKFPHRSWLVALGSSLALFTVMGLGVNVFSVYQPLIIELNGFTNAQGSLITTVRSLFAILAMLMVGGLVQRIGLRTTTVLGMVASVLSCLVYGMATTFPVYCLGSALAGFAYAFAGMIPLSIAIARWFSIRRGYALGLASAGSGVATIVAPTFITRSLQTQGLALTFIYEAGVIAILTVLVLALVRNSPEQEGLVPYGGNQSTKDTSCGEKTSTLSPAVWGLVLFAAFLCGAPVGAGFSHLTVLYSTEGFSDQQITFLLSYLGFIIMVGKLVYGQLRDILGGFRSNFILFGTTILGCILCCLAPTVHMTLAVAAITCVGVSLSISIALSLWALDLSSTAQYERRVRIATIAFMIGNLCFGPTPGLIADATGSYVLAYALFGVISVVAMAIIQCIYLYFNRRVLVMK